MSLSPEVADALRAAGWSPGRRLSPEALAPVFREIGLHEGRFGGRITDWPAAVTEVVAEYGGLAIGTAPAGEQVNPRPFAIDPTLAAHTVDTLIDAGRAIGTRLYPIGVEGLDEAVLAMNALGQVFAIDAAGEWFLGDTIDAALDTLVLGRLPVRIGYDGRWPGRVWQDGSPIGVHKRPVGAAFFLPRTPANLHQVWLPDTLTRIGTVPQADPVEPAILTVEWGGLDCEAHVLDLEHFTVLALVFDRMRLVDQLIAAETAGTGPGAIPLVQAFRSACLALASDVDVAFVHTRQTHQLLRFVADHEADVLTADSAGLVAEGLSMVYLSPAFASGLPPEPAGEARDELPAGGGRLFFAGTGPERW